MDLAIDAVKAKAAFASRRSSAYNASVGPDDRDPAATVQAESGTPPSGTEGMEFDKAAYAEPTVARTCAGCKQVIGIEYFEVGGQTVCRACRDQLVGASPDRFAFLRALLYGGLVGIAGTVVWSLIVHFTGYELGLIAILVGIGVGVAVRKGSGARGGWKYQALAMVLTYVSITTSYVPIILKGFVQGGQETSAAGVVRNKASEELPPRDDSQVVPADKPIPVTTEAATGGMPAPIALLAFLALVWGLALAAPFLAGTSNIMGIIIIAIGLYEAWKFNRRLVVTGPYKLAPSSADPPIGTVGP